ncbi:MAG: methylmalonyl Co-A mutase-associated GTPase MeaB [Bauldia litoralis]
MTLDDLRAGGKPAIARALAALETAPHDPATLDLLDQANGIEIGQVVGLTGPPGVGKSTLLGRLIAEWRRRGLTVGVVAVDPSSPRSRGALLGDRARIATDPSDAGVYIRSMATRGQLGGLAGMAFPAVVLLRALFDRVVVETVGVGQSELDVAMSADTVVLCVQPGAGDALQFLKSGIMEIPDLIVVNKADMGAVAQQARSDLASALSLSAGGGGWETRVLETSGRDGTGVDQLADDLETHRAWLTETGSFAPRRRDQVAEWVKTVIRDRFGAAGLERIGEDAMANAAPFRALADSLARLGGTP